MNRLLLTFCALMTALGASARHYDFSAQLISTADGLPSNVVVQIWQDETGYMWFDTRNGVCRYDGYAFLTFNRDSVAVPPRADTMQTRDATWRREGQGRLSRLDRDGTTRSWQLIPKAVIGYTRNDHFHVADVDERTEAISTYGSGLYLYDKPTGELTQLSKADGRGLLDDDYLTGLYVDRTGCIWLIEDYIGVKCLRMNRLRYRPLWLQPGATIQDANYVRCIAPAADGCLLVANQMGDVYSYDPTTDTFTFVSNNGYRIYSSLLDTHGRLWTGTRGNGLWCDGKQVQGLPSKLIFNIRESRRGVVVSMLEGGVTVISEDGKTKKMLGGRNVHDALCDRDNRLWAATEEGLYLLNVDGQTVDSLPGCFVCLYTDSQGRLWAGNTNAGLVKADTANGHIAPTYYNIGNGLANNSVCTLTEDHCGQLWIGTEEGLSLLDPATGNVTNYQVTESRTANVFCERTAICLPDGRLLFGTHNGIIEVEDGSRDAEDASPKKNDSSLLTTITGQQVNGTNLSPLTPHLSPLTSHPLPPTSHLTSTQNNLTFLFSNFQYADRQSVRYQYRLDGADHDWNEPTAEHAAVYRHLPPGHYVFRVRSKTGMSQWGPEATFSLRIHQPWWNTWWAWCLYLLTAALVGWVVTAALRRIMRLHRSLEVERRVAAFKQDFYDRVERELRNPINVMQGAAENVQLSGTSKTTVQSLRRGSKRMLKLIEMIRQFHQLDDMEMRARAEQDAMNAEAEQRFREIQQTIHAEEEELKEMAPPPINDGHAILIIEADEDNLTHLSDTLNPYFRIVSTPLMADAPGLVSEHSPSLVLIDITADEHAAHELTQAIHKAHTALPVIHISAYDDDSHQLRSLRMGAADYIVKPFSGKILLERITKSIERSTVGGEQRLLTSVKDKRFLDQFHALLASHVSDVNFSVEQFASLMNLGRTQFYKKVKALTGETPVQHLHRARLDYAAHLLRDTTATVEEVMNLAGFNSPTHFYRSFKQQFGLSPRELREGESPSESVDP